MPDISFPCADNGHAIRPGVGYVKIFGLVHKDAVRPDKAFSRLRISGVSVGFAGEETSDPLLF